MLESFLESSTWPLQVLWKRPRLTCYYSCWLNWPHDKLCSQWPSFDLSAPPESGMAWSTLFWICPSMAWYGTKVILTFFSIPAGHTFFKLKVQTRLHLFFHSVYWAVTPITTQIIKGENSSNSYTVYAKWTCPWPFKIEIAEGQALNEFSPVL